MPAYAAAGTAGLDPRLPNNNAMYVDNSCIHSGTRELLSLRDLGSGALILPNVATNILCNKDNVLGDFGRNT